MFKPRALIHCVACLFCIGFAVGAEKSLAPHVHGVGKMNFVLDYESGEGSLQFSFPALQVLGFERVPKNETEKKAVESSRALLKEPQNVFTLVSKGKSSCVFGESKLKIPYLSDHVHTHKEGEVDHADYELEYELKCKNIRAIEGFRVEAFQKLKGLEKLEVQGLAGEKTIRLDLTSKKREFIFAQATP